MLNTRNVRFVRRYNAPALFVHATNRDKSSKVTKRFSNGFMTKQKKSEEI